MPTSGVRRGRSYRGLDSASMHTFMTILTPAVHLIDFSKVGFRVEDPGFSDLCTYVYTTILTPAGHLIDNRKIESRIQGFWVWVAGFAAFRADGEHLNN